MVITKDTSQKIKTKGFVNNALSIFLCQSWQRLFFKAAILCKSLESLVISLYFSRKKGNGFSKLLKFIIQIKALKDLQKAWRSLACWNQHGCVKRDFCTVLYIILILFQFGLRWGLPVRVMYQCFCFSFSLLWVCSSRATFLLCQC